MRRSIDTGMALAWTAGAWLAGTAAAATFGRGAWPLALAIAAASLTAFVIRRQRRALLYALVLPVLFLAAGARYEASRPSIAPDGAAIFNDGPDMRIRAVLRDDPDIGDTSQRYAASVRAVQVDGAWREASGGVLVYDELYPRYESGDVLELEGKLETPPHLDGFDYADYLARRGIQSTMAYPKARLIGHEDDSLIDATVLHVRRTLSGSLARTLPEPQASLAQGVLLGQRSALPADLSDDLNTTNTSHLVVVSGSNVVYVSAFATMLFGWLVGRRRGRLLSIAAVVAYVMLIGPSPPVVRALIMGVLVVLAGAAGRRGSAATALLVAAAIMVGLDAQIIRDVSFQLSFASAAGIVYVATPLRRWLIEGIAFAFRVDELPHWIAVVVDPLAITVAAIAATAPLLALDFGRLSLVALPANVLVVPAFPFILASSLVAALAGLLPAFRLPLAAPAYYLLSYWIDIARWLASLPHAAAEVGGYSSRYAIATYAAIAVAGALFVRYARPPEVSRLTVSRLAAPQWLRGAALLAVPAAALVASASFVLWPSADARLRVTVLDVGQGDAILIRTPDGQNVLVDGGPGGAVVRGLGNELPWYDRRIDLVVLTQPQRDHASGLIDVLARYDVRRVLAGPSVGGGPTNDAWLASVDAEGLRTETALQGLSIDLGEGLRIDVLGPDAAMADDPEPNNRSLVLRLSWRGVSFLLTGDIEARAERELIATGADLRATVLKVPHHGSTTSSTPAFLNAVRPSIAIISSGKDNPLGHPARQVVHDLDAYARVYNTADDGDVRIETDGHRVDVSTGR
jgi:competence protein ComEC